MTDIRTAASAAAEDNHVPFTRIFLTGGSGYVGRNLIRHFLARGVDVVALVRSDKSAEVVRRLGAEPFLGDVLGAGIDVGMTGCDALVHAAADTGHGPPTARQARVNEEGTRNVMRAAQVAGVRKAIHLSTESILASGRPLVNVAETSPIPTRPVGGYSRTKAAAEGHALAANASGLEAVVLRPRFVWGRDNTTALPALTAAVRSGKFAWIAGGDYKSSTTHIVNLCASVEQTLKHGRGGEVYFVSDGEAVQFRTFVSALLETQGLTHRKNPSRTQSSGPSP